MIHKFFITALLLSLLVSCESTSTATKNDLSEVDAVKIVNKYIEKNKLINIPIQCTRLFIGDHGDTYKINIREKHNRPCGGIPEIEPNILFLTIDKKTKRITVDEL